jgi:putative heme-binding domain-containing protein
MVAFQFRFRFLVSCALSFPLAIFSADTGLSQEKDTGDPSAPTANEEVQKFVESFKGKGALTDDSEPSSPEVALKQFQVFSGVNVELIASEPIIEQPLSMNFDTKGRMWVVQYRQYPFPAGLKIVRYDQYLRAVYDKVPVAPPHHVPGLDRVTVFEDRDGNGTYDSNHDFVSDLNIVSSVLPGQDGVWILNPPYLLFYPDQDDDAKPDGPPEVHLSGFGIEDTHSIASSLTWGPDGWIYGANGSTTTGNVRTRKGVATSFSGQCVWRYHPKRELFEIYAEGGGNTFSLEIDSVGRVFSGTNNGSTRGMYYPQGSYGEKNWGKHGSLTNPFAFGFFKHMRFEGDADRFAQTFLIYEGGSLPETFHQRIISANALHNRVWTSQLLPDTSTFRTVDQAPILESTDRWFRPVDVKVGPDGAVYLCDWYDSRLSHVDPRDTWHKSSGRIYRLESSERKMASDGDRASQSQPGSADSTDGFGLVGTPTRFDLSQWKSADLIKLFSHPNKFFQQAAVRVLGNRHGDEVGDLLIPHLTETNSPKALTSLWTLHQLGLMNEDLSVIGLGHENPHVRRWTVRLLGDDRLVPGRIVETLTTLARREEDISVRAQLACSAKRLPSNSAFPILNGLLQHDGDVDDLHQGLLLWWALEAHCMSSETQTRELIQAAWNRPLVKQFLLSRLMQRWAQASPPHWTGCVWLIDSAPTLSLRHVLIEGLKEAMAGSSKASLPSDVQSRLEDYYREAGVSNLPLQVKLGDASAIQEAIKKLGDTKVPIAEKIELVEVLGRTKASNSLPSLLKLLSQAGSPSLQRVALQALAQFEEESIGVTICKLLHTSVAEGQNVQATAFQTLASRPAWSKLLLAEVSASRLKAQAIPIDLIQQMRLHSDKQLQDDIQKIWGNTRATPKELEEKIGHVRSLLKDGQGKLEFGHQIFSKKCATCHTLFDEGGKAGPNLTGYERDNLGFMIPSIVDPSSAIREEFTQFQVLTDDGRVVFGLIENQDAQSVTLRKADNQLERLDRDAIEKLQASSQSIMPEGLLNDLDPQQVRDLFAYLTVRTYRPRFKDFKALDKP